MQEFATMPAGKDILKLLMEKSAEAARKAQRGLILQPGAIGDCILTLPLVKFMKEQLKLGSVDILGHMQYLSILPGRSCVDCVLSLESVQLHRLFVNKDDFDLADGDPLINAFAGYTWIISFLGEPDSDFEQNLIFTANCSHSAEVIILSMKPSEGLSCHITDFFIEQLVQSTIIALEKQPVQLDAPLIKPQKADIDTGKALLQEIGVDTTKKLAVIHPGSGGKQKCWHIDNFVTLARQIDRKGHQVLFLLGPAEMERFDQESFKKLADAGTCAMHLSLPQILSLLSCAECYVGNDSGITHLAAALGVRTVAVFGPSDPVLYRPVGPAVTVLTDPSPEFSQAASDKLHKKIVDLLVD